jgi:hypothetical protein
MNLLSIFRRKPAAETRASGTGFTAEVLAARDSYISGSRGLAELTAAAQGCVSLWEGGLAQADVSGTDALDAATLGLIARGLALRGEAVFLIRDRLIPAADWDVSTRDGRPVGYRLQIPDAGGGRTETALAGEVLHIRLAADPVAPWSGQAPLRRSSLSAGLLHAVEDALTEVYATAPIGSQVVPMPENPDANNDKLARSFRGQRGRVLLRESVTVSAAGGPAPAADWRPSDLTPDLEKALPAAALEAARGAIAHAFGVLPALLNASTTGPVVREAQRHLAMWTLTPIARLIADEATAKLGGAVALDPMAPLQAYDAGGRARAFKGMVEALAAARDAGLTDDQIAAVARFAGTSEG